MAELRPDVIEFDAGILDHVMQPCCGYHRGRVRDRPHDGDHRRRMYDVRISGVFALLFYRSMSGECEHTGTSLQVGVLLDLLAVSTPHKGVDPGIIWLFLQGRANRGCFDAI